MNWDVEDHYEDICSWILDKLILWRKFHFTWWILWKTTQHSTEKLEVSWMWCLYSKERETSIYTQPQVCWYNNWIAQLYSVLRQGEHTRICDRTHVLLCSRIKRMHALSWGEHAKPLRDKCWKEPCNETVKDLWGVPQILISYETCHGSITSMVGMRIQLWTVIKNK